MSLNYNIVNLDITNGLDRKKLMTGSYIYLEEAPDNANITIALGADADGLQLSQGKNIQLGEKPLEFYISCDAVAGASIRLVIADSDSIKISDTPSFAFNESAKSALRFAARTCTNHTIVNGGTLEVLKGGNTAIKLHSTEEIYYKIDAETTTFPIFEDIITLDNITNKITLLNNSGVSSTISIQYM